MQSEIDLNICSLARKKQPTNHLDQITCIFYKKDKTEKNGCVVYLSKAQKIVHYFVNTLKTICYLKHQY